MFVKSTHDCLLIQNRALDFSFQLKLSSNLRAHREYVRHILNLSDGEMASVPIVHIGVKEAEIREEGLTDCTAVNDRLFRIKHKIGVNFFDIEPSFVENINNFSLWKVLHVIAYKIGCQISKSGGLPVHSALFEHRGKGILIAGKSGAGKTTMFSNAPSHWKAMADDCAFVVKSNQGYVVHPYVTPSELLAEKKQSVRDINISTSLKGLFFLEQSAFDDIEQISRLKAASALYEVAASSLVFYYRDFLNDPQLKNLRKDLFNNACDIVNVVPAYRLRASRYNTIWPILEKAIHNEPDTL